MLMQKIDESKPMEPIDFIGFAYELEATRRPGRTFFGRSSGRIVPVSVRSGRREESFVVRIWREGQRGPQWRACVTHVGSSDRRYFTNYGDLCEFLDRWIAEHREHD
jgi:hypothetical protein